MATCGYIPKRWSFRRYIMDRCNRQGCCQFPVSHKDILRMERPDKHEIPVNIVDILKIIVKEIKGNKNNFNYRAQDDLKVSLHILYYTINSLMDFKLWLDHYADENIYRIERGKYQEEVDYIVERLNKFNREYPGVFNSLFT